MLTLKDAWGDKLMVEAVGASAMDYAQGGVRFNVTDSATVLVTHAALAQLVDALAVHLAKFGVPVGGQTTVSGAL